MINPIDILRLISELEGSYQHLKKLGFVEDCKTIEAMKPNYYKMYFRLCKEQGRNPLG